MEKQVDPLRAQLLSSLPGYGPVPFLALNDRLDKRRLKAALEELARAGMGGIFLHPRTGLEVEYLSEEFFERVGYAIETCAKLGIQAWLYDEYNWPSGMVAGKLLSRYPELGQVYLDYLLLKKPKPGRRIQVPGKILQVYSVTEDIKELKDCYREDQLILPRIEGELLVFYQSVSSERLFSCYCANWIKPVRGYVDLFNPKVAEKVIEMVYEEYAKRFSQYFGKTIKGIFLDEPQHYNGFPWSEIFQKEFTERYGYDVLEYLYLLVLDRPGYIKFRTEYYQLVEELTSKSFYQPLSLWCQEHNLVLTGHLSQEERLSQMAVNHGGVYCHLSRMQIPGIDALNAGDGLQGGLAWMEAPNYSVKMVSSIAHINGFSRVLCEAGGGAGWKMSLGEFKRMTDWLFALGINFLNPHQSLISVKGIRKRDFPPSHFWQEPWWRYYPEFSRYVSRLSRALSQGVHQAEIGLLIPTSTFWALSRGRGENKKLKELSSQIEETCKFLISYLRDFEIIFEEAIWEEKVKIKKGRVVAGNEEYPALVIPFCPVLNQQTLNFLLEFAQRGGWIFFLEKLPEFNHLGEEVRAWQERILSFSGRVKILAGEYYLPRLTETLARVFPARLSLESYPYGLVSQARRIGDDEIYFIANLTEQAVSLKGLLRTGKKSLQAFYPWEGKQVGIIQFPDKEGIRFQLELEGRESVLLVAGEEQAPDWIKKTNLIPLRYDFEQIEGYSRALPVKIEGKAGEVKVEVNLPEPVELKGPFQFQPSGLNYFRLGPWKVKGEQIKPRSLSELKKELDFTLRTRGVVYALRIFLPVFYLFFRPRSKFRELVYEDFVEFAQMEEASGLGKAILGIDFTRLGFYQAIEVLYRILDYLPQYLIFPAPGSRYQAEAEFNLEKVTENLELVWEDLGEPVEIVINQHLPRLEVKKSRVWDEDNFCAEVSRYLKSGKNKIIFRSRMPDYPTLYPCWHTIEPVVLRGEFEVRKNHLKPGFEPTKPLGDLKKLGYVHYSGSVEYSFELALSSSYQDYWLVLDLGKVEGAVEVKINGKPAGLKLAPPYQFALSDFIRAGNNQFQFILTNTASNLLSLPKSFGIFGPVRIFPYPRIAFQRREIEKLTSSKKQTSL